MATAAPSRPRDIPAVPQTVDQAVRDPLSRVREEVQRLLGFVGVDRLDMAVTWRQLAEQGFADLDRVGLPGRGVPGSLIVPGSAIDLEPDLTPPPDPTGLNAAAGFSFVTVEWDSPVYTQGHGHGQTNVYAVKRSIPDPNPLPVFGDAALISNEFAPTTIASYASEMRTRWHIWIKWQSVDGVESLNPAGGTNGFTVDTGEDVTQLLDALTTAALSPGSSYSKVIFRADLFAIAPELDFYEETTPTGTVVGQLWGVPSTGVIKTWDGDSWEAFNAPLPFVVNTAAITEDGVSIPAGVYMDAAYIRNLSAMTARFGTATIDGATIANLDAGIINAGFLDADRIDAGTLTADKLSVTNLAAITANMGAITAGSIDLDTSGFIRGGQTGFDTGTGFWLGYNAGAFKFSIGNSAGNKLTWNGTTLNIVGGGTFSGTLSAASGTFAGTLTAAAINAVDTINIDDEAISANYFETIAESTSSGAGATDRTVYIESDLVTVSRGTLDTFAILNLRVVLATTNARWVTFELTPYLYDSSNTLIDTGFTFKDTRYAIPTSGADNFIGLSLPQSFEGMTLPDDYKVRYTVVAYCYAGDSSLQANMTLLGLEGLVQIINRKV